MASPLGLTRIRLTKPPGWSVSYYLNSLAEGAPVSGTGVAGRDRELAAVAAFLDAVPSEPCGLLLEGAPGIGKTTVWSAGAALAAGRSYTVLSSQPTESEATLSFAALGDLMDGVLDQALRQLPSPQRRALEVALLLQDPVGSPPEQRAVSVAFLAVIRHLSASGPVVLAIDDLQWLDVPSARAVEFAVRRLTHERAGLLASVRDGEDGRPASAARTGLLAERLTRLRIGPLPFGAFQSAVRGAVGSRLSRTRGLSSTPTSGASMPRGPKLKRLVGGHDDPGSLGAHATQRRPGVPRTHGREP
jgi:hypothetical protein